MRHGRLLGLIGVTAAVVCFAAAPAGAISLSLGTPGSGLAPPISVPLPVAVSVTTPNNGSPLGLNVNAPGSTSVNVQVGPTTGLDVTATSGDVPPVELKVAAPNPVRAPVAVSAPVAPPSPASAPLSPSPSPSPAPVPVSPAPPHAPAPPDVATKPITSRPIAPRVATGTAIATTPGDPASARSTAGAPGASATRFTTITASIASTQGSGVLFALHEIGANIALWLALVVSAIAAYWFASSALAARRRATRAA